jgi:hypothetical protein
MRRAGVHCTRLPSGIDAARVGCLSVHARILCRQTRVAGEPACVPSAPAASTAFAPAEAAGFPPRVSPRRIAARGRAVTGARVAGLPGGAARIADVIVTAGAGIVLREAGRRVPSRLGRAAIAYAGTLVVLGVQRGVRR